MPMITIKYDDKKVEDAKVITLSTAIQKIVVEVTKIKDVFVYADSPKIKVGVAPIEIFVEISASEVQDKKEVIHEIKNQLSAWKKDTDFNYPIIITLIPMDWVFEVGI